MKTEIHKERRNFKNLIVDKKKKKPSTKWFTTNKQYFGKVYDLLRRCENIPGMKTIEKSEGVK